MITQVIQIIHKSHTEPIDAVLRNLSEVVCQIFGFQRSTIALLDPRKHAFVKQTMIGYAERELNRLERQSLEVPQRVIERLFADISRVRPSLA
jgi:uncharacterized Fe-S cluster-containing radical SAM superfamily protein